MTQLALTRLVQRHVPDVVYLPNVYRGSCDSVQRSSDRYVGYRALWMKVIIRAAFDWVSYRDSTKLEHKKIAEHAHAWLFQPSELFNSFESICQLVDLPPDKLRVWVKRLTKAHVAKIEHLERDSTNPLLLIEAERRLVEDLPEEV